LRRDCHLKHVIEGKIGETERWGRRRKELLDDLMKTEKILKVARGNDIYIHIYIHICLNSSLWETLWTCRKADDEVNGTAKPMHFPQGM